MTNEPVKPGERSGGGLLGARGADAYRLLVQSVRDYAVYMLDADGRVATWNLGAEQLYGYVAAEILGVHCLCFHESTDVEQGQSERELSLARAEGSYAGEDWRVRKDGSRFWSRVAVTPIVEAGAFLGFAVVVQDRTEARLPESQRTEERRVAAEDLHRYEHQLAMVALEVKKSAAPILNALEIVRNRPPDDPSPGALTIIERHTAYLVRLGDELLDAARVARGQLELRTEPLDLVGLVSEMVGVNRPKTAAVRPRFSVSLPSDALWVEGDAFRLKQAIGHLLQNARKYTGADGRISVTLDRQTDRVVVRVCDTGSGIAPELLGRLYEKFVKDDRSLDQSEGGFGLGLVVVKTVIELHGGTVAAASDGPGCGSEFTVTLPLLQDQDAYVSGAAEPARSRRVLVIDDNVDAALALVELVQAWGHEARCVHDAPAAMAAISPYRPDVLLVDIGLPGIDGCRLARRVRLIPGRARGLVLALAGYGQEEDQRRSHEAGFDHYLVKPVDPEELKQLLRWSRKSEEV